MMSRLFIRTIGAGVLSVVLSATTVWASIDRSIGTTQVDVYNGKTTEVSVISYAFMQELFDQLSSHPRIPFKFPDDGCYARAHKMSILLEQRGIITLKSFVIGDLRVKTPNHPRGWVEWWYHVAPALYVKDLHSAPTPAAAATEDGELGVETEDADEGLTLMIFDPSIFDDPVSYLEWVGAMVEHRTGRVSESYNTLRFVYTPGDLTSSEELRDYLIQDLVDMETTLELYKELERVRQEGVTSEDYLF